jgi:hypothetical protein
MISSDINKSGWSEERYKIDKGRQWKSTEVRRKEKGREK